MNNATETEKAATLLLTPHALVTLSMDDAITVAGYMVHLEFEEKCVIFKAAQQGVASDYMLLVMEGEVLVETVSSGDGTAVINVLQAGHLIGEMSVLDGEPRSATCTALTTVLVAMLSRTNLEKLIGEHPKIAARLLTAIAKRLADRVRLGNQKLLMLSQVNLAMQQEIEAKALIRRHRSLKSTSV